MCCCCLLVFLMSLLLMLLLCFIEYQRRLDVLQSDPIPAVAHCAPLGCTTRPVCHTNYSPHHNPQYYIDNIIVGNHSGWSYIGERSQEEVKGGFGYQDNKPYYECTQPSTELYLQVKVGAAQILHICGDLKKESMKHAHFLLDVNVTTSAYMSTNSSRKRVLSATDSDGASDSVQQEASDESDHPHIHHQKGGRRRMNNIKDVPYTPSDRRIPIKTRHFIGNECTELTHLPIGQHVLTIRTDDTLSHGKSTGLTHVIEFL